MHANWSEVDWTKADSAIAKEVGVSRQRVHQVRKGGPKKTVHVVGPKLNAIQLIVLGALWSHPDRDLYEVGDQYGKGSGTFVCSYWMELDVAARVEVSRREVDAMLAAGLLEKKTGYEGGVYVLKHGREY